MSTDPQIRQFEKTIANDTRTDQKTLDHAIKDVKSATKTHTKTVKAADKAQHALDKAVKKEYDAATALNKAQHKHQAAIADHQTAEKTLKLKQQHEAKLLSDLEQKRTSMEDLQHRNDLNDQKRETKLSNIHAQAASRGGSLDVNRPAEMQHGGDPAGPAQGNGVGGSSASGPGMGPAQAGATSNA